MIDDNQDAMGHGYQRPFLTSPAGQPPVLGRQIGSLGVTGCPSDLNQRRAQPLVPLGRATTLALARTLVAAWTYPHPGTQMTRTGKLLHVRADLRHNILRGPLSDAGNLHEPQHLLRDRLGEHGYDPRTQALDQLL